MDAERTKYLVLSSIYDENLECVSASYALNRYCVSTGQDPLRCVWPEEAAQLSRERHIEYTLGEQTGMLGITSSGLLLLAALREKYE